MSGLTILGMCLFAIVLYLRWKAAKARPVKSTPYQRLKLARVLALSLLAFLAISMRLSRTIDGLDAKPRQPLTWWQQILERF